jgi:hypothetical protein
LGVDLGESACFQVLQNGNQIMLFDLYGYAALQFEVAQR